MYFLFKRIINFNALPQQHAIVVAAVLVFVVSSALGRSCQPPGLLPAPPYARATAIELSEKGYLAGKKKTYLFIVFLWRLGIRPKPHTILLKNVKHTPTPPPSLAHASGPAPGGHWELWAKRDTRVLGATGPELSRTQTLSRPAQDNTWWFVVGYLANKATEIRPFRLNYSGSKSDTTGHKDC